MRKRLCCAALALTLLLSGCDAARSVVRTPSRAAATAAPLEPIVRPEEPKDAEALPVYLDGLLLSRGYRREDAVYAALRPLCAHANITMSWSGNSEHFTLELGALRVDALARQKYFTVSGRYLYAPEDWLIRGGELYLPVDALCRLLTLTAEERDGALYLDGSGLCLMQAGTDYYELNFPSGDLFWLAHIIHSEAGIEPMESKIGVGNVVMNRVKSPDFPDNVFDVIFDHEHSMQFEPISKGTIYEEPTEKDTIAACLVLEGADVAGECLYFVNPDYGSFWFDNNLQFVKKIGRHNYYIERVNENAATDAGTDPAAGT